MAHDVFISYATEDKRVADAVCAAVEAREFRCWMAPRDVLAGMSYGDAITKAIQNCRVMVLVFSSHANTSPHIPKEIERAVTRQSPIIPFRVEDVQPSDALDYFVSSVHWLDAVGGSLDGHLTRLADAVEQTLAGGGASAAKPAAQRPTLWGKVSSLPAAAARGIRGLGRQALIFSACVAIVAAAIGGLAVWYLKPSERQVLRPLVRLDVDLGSDVSLGPRTGVEGLMGTFSGPDMVLSPDGTRLVYVSQTRLFTRRMDQPTAVELPGTNGAFAPFFSPDGQWVAFFAQGRLKKVSVEGGALTDLCAAFSPFGGSWGEDGNIIASLSFGRGLSRISADGGIPTPATEVAQGESAHRWPQVLPGAKAVLFTANFSNTAWDSANIEVVTLGNHSRKVLLRGGTYGRYLPSGHLVYVSRGTLFAVPFDLEKLEVRGRPVSVLDGVDYSIPNGDAQFDFSRSGTLVYRKGEGGSGLVTVQWLDSAGQTEPLLAKPGDYNRPRLSPDGQMLGLQVTDGSSTDLWSYDWRRDTMTRLTFGGTGSTPTPIWTPDGRYVVYQAAAGISWTPAGGAGQPQPLSATSVYDKQ